MTRRFKLIPDWRRGWRFASNVAATLLGVLSLVQADALPAIRPLLPEAWWPWVSAGFAVAIVVARLIRQPGLDAGPSTSPRTTGDASA